MHQLSLHDTNTTIHWRLRNGAFQLPIAKAGTPGPTVVFVDDAALLLDTSGKQMLVDSLPTPLQHTSASIVWRRETQHASERSTDVHSHSIYGYHPTFQLCHTNNAIPLTTNPVIVGRHPFADLHLSDSKISYLHAVLWISSRGLRILDLQSTNGTFVNGRRVYDHLQRTPASLSFGAVQVDLRSDVEPELFPSALSPKIIQLRNVVRRVAPADVTVLIQGESGSGKEQIAQAIHSLSLRSGAFVALNAAAIHPTLAGSELFGHVRGAFTGADKDRDGAFVQAHQGTLFLDEIADLPPSIQAELLRVLETRRVRRVGDSQEIAVDVRLVSATHKDLASEVRAGHFRHDLFHRLCVMPILVPPLRERAEDIEAIAQEFFSKCFPNKHLSNAALIKLQTYSWPGNVREFLNVLNSSCLLSSNNELSPDDIQLQAWEKSNADKSLQRAVVDLYTATQGNIAETAKQLGMHRATVYRYLQKAKGQKVA